MQLIPTVAFPSSFPTARTGGRRRTAATLETPVHTKCGVLRSAGTAEKRIDS